MGLDMYLSKRKFIGAQYEHRKVSGTVDIKIGEKQVPIDFKKLSYVEEEACYWRKANAIHKWFVDNCQEGIDDCREHYVERSDLETLLEKCKAVKKIAKLKKGKITNGQKLTEEGWVDIIEDGKYITNADEIEKILPTEDGCFFGSTAYDEYYMEDIEYTIEKLEEILKEEDELNKQGFYSDFIYQSSW